MVASRLLLLLSLALSLALALGQDPSRLPRSAPTAGAAASLVYRVFRPGAAPAMPSLAQQAGLRRLHPDALLFCYPKSGHALQRDFKWLGNHRYGIVHLGGKNESDLRANTLRASALLGWTAPYADQLSAAACPPVLAAADWPKARPF